MLQVTKASPAELRRSVGPYIETRIQTRGVIDMTATQIRRRLGVAAIVLALAALPAAADYLEIAAAVDLRPKPL